MTDCFRRNKNTDEITSFHFPLKNLKEYERIIAIEMLQGFARGAKDCDEYDDIKHDLWNVVQELENGKRTRQSRWE